MKPQRNTLQGIIVSKLVSFWDKLRYSLAVSTVLVLTACGGGGGAEVISGGPTSTTQSVSGVIASGVVSIPQADAAAATFTLGTTQTDSLLVSNPTGALASAKTGQIVALPANDAQGIPFGLTAKVLKNPDGSLLLQPAALEDVFNKLNIDFDTARDGAKIAGLISPKDGSISFSQAAPVTSVQSALEYASCQLGLLPKWEVPIKCNNGVLEGRISLNQ